MSDPPATMRVTIAFAAPGCEALVEVPLPAGAKLADAVARSGIVERLALDPTKLEYAVFGQRAKGGTPLLDGDRVEITRPLVADPKLVRHLRAAGQSPRRSAAK